MNGYGITGLLLLLAALIWLSRDLLKARRPKRGRHDKEVRRVTLLVRLRNASAISAICAFSVFLFTCSGVSKVATESKEYEILNDVGDFTVGMSFVLVILVIVLSILNRKASYLLSLSVRRDAIKARIRAYKQKKMSKLTRG